MYVGNDYQEYSGSQTTLVDLHGKMLVPGSIDDHVHFLDGGYYLANIDLRNAGSKTEVTILFFDVARIPQRVVDGSGGGNWDHEAWGGETSPRVMD